jgi:hypothetical protein
MKHIATKCLFIFVLLFGCLFVFAQAPDTIWTRTYGGPYDEEAESGAATPDGCYLLAGYTTSFNAWQGDYYLVKFNSAGDTVWTKRYGGSQSDYGRDVVATPDRGYAILGKSGTGPFRSLLIKTDSLGNAIWQKYYGVTQDENPWGLTTTYDSGFAIVGTYDVPGPTTNYDIKLVRTKSNGDTLWTRTYGTANTEDGYGVVQTADSGFIIAGVVTYPSYYTDIYLVKTNKSGDTVWTKKLGGASSDYAWAIHKVNDGGFIIVGNTSSFSSMEHVYLIKLYPSGNVEWTSVIGGDRSVRGYDVCETSDHGFAITGTINMDFPKYHQVYLLRTNSHGDSLWSTMCGGDGFDIGRFVHQDGEGKYIVGGSWNYSSSNRGFYAIKFAAEVTSVEENHSISNDFILHQNYPNPFNPTTTIQYNVPKTSYVTLKIFNLIGQEVARLVNGIEEPGNKTVSFNANGLTSGVYYYRLQAGSFIETKKLLLLR